MLRTSIAALVLVSAACGGGSSNSDAPPGSADGPPGGFDGPPQPDASTAACVPNSGTTVTAAPVVTVDDVPILITAPPGDRRLFIVQRSGEIDIHVDGALLPAKFMDIRDNNGGPVLAGDEQGLLGLAFHPQYATNRKFYVYFTTTRGGADYNEVAEYQTMAGNPDVADTSTFRRVLSIPDPYSNHNGGMIEFGTDGFLYISTGDGGLFNDPQENGQNPNRLLAKMLRIDVDNLTGGRQYGIPPTNPFADGVAGAPEVYMTGLRNPWRWSFDAMTGDIYIGDVGQGAVEEINVISAANAAGADFGWDDCEGSRDFEAGGCAAPTQPNRILPVHEEVRPSAGGPSPFQAIIGGQVYRGTCFPALQGRYFFSDNNASGLYSFVYAGGAATDLIEHSPTAPNRPTSIHADGFGELYVGDMGGRVLRIEAN
jgi:glucose/arabinose dehydrogenase